MQQQFMMMNMMSNYGANYYMPKNNMFVRRAKGSEQKSRPRRARNPASGPGREVTQNSHHGHSRHQHSYNNNSHHHQ